MGRQFEHISHVWGPQMKPFKINIRYLSEIHGILENKLEWAELLLSRNQCLSCMCMYQKICKDKLILGICQKAMAS